MLRYRATIITEKYENPLRMIFGQNIRPDRFSTALSAAKDTLETCQVFLTLN
jgi:hypothetical protein